MPAHLTNLPPLTPLQINVINAYLASSVKVRCDQDSYTAPGLDDWLTPERISEI